VRAQIRLRFIKGVPVPAGESPSGMGGDEDFHEDEEPKKAVMNKSEFLTHLEKTKYRCKVGLYESNAVYPQPERRLVVSA
jgi:hypothetical protein